MIGMKPKEKEQNAYYQNAKEIIKNTVWNPNTLKPILRNNTIKLPHANTSFHDAMKYMFKNYCDDMADVMSNYMTALGVPRSLYGIQYIKKFK
jgi:hypothetical protein